MSPKPRKDPDIEPDAAFPEALTTRNSFLLADYGLSGTVEVELVDFATDIESPRPGDLVADYTCEV